MIFMRPFKQFNTIIAVVGTAIATFELMMRTFKWYEKKHGKEQS